MASETNYDKPMAAKGLTSYRYGGRYGWVMIGAKNDTEALREAERSIDGKADISLLEVWDGAGYVPVRSTTPNAREMRAGGSKKRASKTTLLTAEQLFAKVRKSHGK
jgi:hypothetical protein